METSSAFKALASKCRFPCVGVVQLPRHCIWPTGGVGVMKVDVGVMKVDVGGFLLIKEV